MVCVLILSYRIPHESNTTTDYQFAIKSTIAAMSTHPNPIEANNNNNNNYNNNVNNNDSEEKKMSNDVANGDYSNHNNNNNNNNNKKEQKKYKKAHFVCISDTHNMHDVLTKEISELYDDNSDTLNILIHAGDMTNRGSYSELDNIAKWFVSNNYDYTFLISGNMDGIGLDSNSQYGRTDKNKIDGHKLFNSYSNNKNHIYYLENESYYIKEIGLNIYGSPYTLQFVGGFQIYSDKQSDEIWKKIPENTDILITHGPPYKILDSTSHGANVGDKILKRHVEQRIKAKYMIFGHVHESFGKYYDATSHVTYANVAQYNYQYRKEVKPFVFDIDLTKSGKL